MFDKKETGEKEKKPFNETGFGKFFKKAVDVLPEIGGMAFDFIGGPYEQAYDRIVDIIKGSNNPEAPALLREMTDNQRAFKLELEQINLAYYKVDHEDRKRATDREIAFLDSDRFDWEKALVLLAGLAITGVVVYAIIFIEVIDGNRDLFVALVGVVEGSIITQIMNYFFGSSRGSDLKTEILARKK